MLQPRQTCGKQTLSQDDGGDLAAIVNVATRLRTAIAEEIISVRISAGCTTGGVAQSRAPQAVQRVAGQVEMRASLRAGPAEERPAVRIALQEVPLEVPADLIGIRADAGADCRADVARGVAPSPSMLAMVDSSTPPIAPRQPAWAAATTPASGSANRTGVQSAASTPTAMPGVAVTRASARGRSASGQASVTTTAVGLWIWCAVRTARGLQVGGHAGTVLAHGCGLVPRAQAAVQGGIDALRNAAMAREEAVRGCRLILAGLMR